LYFFLRFPTITRREIREDARERLRDEEIKRRNAMKLAIMLLGSTAFVAGGTTLTKNPSSQKHDVLSKQVHQVKASADRDSGDCDFATTPIFANVANIILTDSECTVGSFSSHADIYGNGNSINVFASYFTYYDPIDGLSEVWQPATATRLLPESGPPVFTSEIIIDLHPTVMGYEGGFPHGQQFYDLRTIGLTDINNDGKKDAIVVGSYSDNKYYFYIENISDFPVACTTDVNSDGSTNVNDLLEVVGNWGPCE